MQLEQERERVRIGDDGPGVTATTHTPELMNTADLEVILHFQTVAGTFLGNGRFHAMETQRPGEGAQDVMVHLILEEKTLIV